MDDEMSGTCKLIGIALGYGLDDGTFESRQGLGIFLFTTTSGANPTFSEYEGFFPWG
jgi:hypothetical protein